jgi:Flp pilus assembly protein RcpC/CpaB
MSTAARAARDWRGGWIAPHLRRRILAALLAAAGVLVAFSSLKPSAPAATAAPSRSAVQFSGLGAGLGAGLVAAPVRLVDPGVAPLLHAGQRVDVLAAPESPTGFVDTSATLARVVAHDVRVLAVRSPGAADANLGTLVVLGVTPDDARALAGAEAGGRLSVTLESS